MYSVLRMSKPLFRRVEELAEVGEEKVLLKEEIWIHGLY